MFIMLQKFMVMIFCMSELILSMKYIPSYEFTLRGKGSRLLRRFESSQSVSDVNKSKIKLPVVQIYKDQELVSEIICGVDVLDSYGKLQAVLKTLTASSESNQESWSFVNTIYDDSQLMSLIDSGNTFILKIYRIGCKKCSQFDPLYINLAEDPKYKHIRWFQAEINYIPNYVKDLKSRLMGGDSQEIEACSYCNSTGFIPCIDCEHTGLLTRGSFTVTCPTCVGYKKVRCTACGGKCLKCSV